MPHTQELPLFDVPTHVVRTRRGLLNKLRYTTAIGDTIAYGPWRITREAQGQFRVGNTLTSSVTRVGKRMSAYSQTQIEAIVALIDGSA